MALMEADGARVDDARNALGAMINRAAKTGEDLAAHVSRRIYQPTIEPAQQSRLGRVLSNPAHAELTTWAQRRAQGLEPDPVKGATHFLAHPQVMERLSGGVRPDGRGGYVGNSRKYHSWPQWTGYNPSTREYRNQTTTDRSHAFLAPEGLHSVTFKGVPSGAAGMMALGGATINRDGVTTTGGAAAPPPPVSQRDLTTHAGLAPPTAPSGAALSMPPAPMGALAPRGGPPSPMPGTMHGFGVEDAQQQSAPPLPTQPTPVTPAQPAPRQEQPAASANIAASTPTPSPLATEVAPKPEAAPVTRAGASAVANVGSVSPVAAASTSPVDPTTKAMATALQSPTWEWQNGQLGVMWPGNKTRKPAFTGFGGG